MHSSPKTKINHNDRRPNESKKRENLCNFPLFRNRFEAHWFVTKLLVKLRLHQVQLGDCSSNRFNDNKITRTYPKENRVCTDTCNKIKIKSDLIDVKTVRFIEQFWKKKRKEKHVNGKFGRKQKKMIIDLHCRRFL